MLISVLIENFRSIKEPLKIDLVPTPLRGQKENIGTINKFKFLKTAVVYGSNASGKSNALKAIKALNYIVYKSADYKPGEEIEIYEPYKLCPDCAKKPVKLEIVFIGNDKVKYEYSISFTEDSFLYEKLSYYPKSQPSVLFERKQGLPIKFGEAYKGAQKTIEKQLLDNQLFLTKAAQNNSHSALEPYNFIAKRMYVYPFLDEYRDSTFLNNYFARRLAEEGESVFVKRFNKLICALDTGIQKVTSEEVDWDNHKFPDNMPDKVKKDIQDQFKYDIKAYHRTFKNASKLIPFDISEESAGTQSLLFMIGLILDALDEGTALIVDEFEKNIHPNITKYLISLFHNPIINTRNAQLIFATHDITQLSEQVFRRDQIWFTEKDEDGVTGFYRCSEIKGLRANTPIDKWYSSGRLGATPIINDLDFILEMQSEFE